MPAVDSLYLTFDDGPTPGVTDWLLDLLREHGAKATFFCIGKNVQEAPELYERILAEGHSVGNHTQNHPNGWSTKNEEYFRNVREASEVISSRLFRPPYGKLNYSQYQALKNQYRIVLWDVLSWDFLETMPKEECWTNVEQNLEPGSIIVYHDKTKCLEKLQDNIPRLLEQYGKRYSFEAIPMQ